MAIDTAAKRSSAALVGLPFRFQQPALAGALDDSDRAAIAYLYSGFDYASDDAAPSSAYDWIVQHRRRRGR